MITTANLPACAGIRQVTCCLNALTDMFICLPKVHMTVWVWMTLEKWIHMGFHTGEALRQKAINENADPFRRFDVRDRVSLITAFAVGQINGFSPFSLAEISRTPLTVDTANVCWPAAAFFWHCQEFLPSRPRTPSSSGTARDFWHLGPARRSGLALPTFVGPQPRFSGTAKNFCHQGPTRHSRLALPGISGESAPRATQLWHCQGFLPSRPRAPLTAGTARDFWRPGPAL